MSRRGMSLIPAALFAGVAVAAAVTQQFGPVWLPGAPERIRAIADAIDTLPFIHGSLVGVDSAPMAPAVRLLRPQRLIQRTYTQTESDRASREEEFTLFIVFSPDARDLTGHHPPVCFPSAGWTLDGVSPAVVPAGEHRLEAQSYHFYRPLDAHGGRRRTTATSFFIVPGSPRLFHAQMSAVEAAARDRRAAGLGAIHVMILVGGSPDPARHERILGLAGGVLAQTIDRIAQ